MGVYLFRQKNIRTKEALNVQKYVQVGLTYFCSFNAVHLWCLAFSLFVCKEQKSAYDIADAAKSSFLAVTRNLMVGTARCCLCICAGIEIRSLVRTRDDGVAGTCILGGVCY